MSSFSTRLIKWHKKSGRKNLPWQINKTPYKVWISEIMLQQTQVKTAIPYFSRFIERFPDIETLAASSDDEVLSYWSGLGYYARARNILKTSKILYNEYFSKMPESIEELEALPGIGRSTAGAIMSLGFKKKAAILDGNVKRVLARYLRVEGDIKKNSVLKELWRISEDLLPKKDYSTYTQSIMDIGATICHRKDPSCETCPVEKQCQAREFGEMHLYPNKGGIKTKPTKEVCWLLPKDRYGNIYLEKRESEGLWGGLWTFIEAKDKKELKEKYLNRFAGEDFPFEEFSIVEHHFSHYKLKASVFTTQIENKEDFKIKEQSMWIGYDQVQSVGVPAPIKKIIKEISL